MFDPWGRGPRQFRGPSRGKVSAQHPGWPEATEQVHLPASRAFPQGARVRLRPLLRGDGKVWRQQRIADEEILRPVEPTARDVWEESQSQQAFWDMLVSLRTAALNGRILPMVIEVNGHFAGQMTLDNIQHGSLKECWIGYWVYSAYSGGGVATAACALATDHAFRRVGMHRVAATYMPSNPASGKVLKASGYREEGFLRRYIHIDGRWEDHHLVGLVRDDFPDTCVDRLRAAGRIL